MNEDVRMPIETSRDGDKITKICVEDVYKMVNRINEQLCKFFDNSQEILDSIEKKYYPSNEEDVVYTGHLIVGKGVSQPCNGDEFKESIGNDIAFMKAKLNANLKKYRILNRIYSNIEYLKNSLREDRVKINNNILRDIEGIRKYNPDFMNNYEEE